MKRSLKVAFVVLAFACGLGLVSCGGGQGSADSAITVSATASANIVPDHANISIQVAGEGATEDEAEESADAIADEVSARLGTLGIEGSQISKSASTPEATAGSAQVVEEPTGYFDWFGNWVDTGVQQYTTQYGGYEQTITLKVAGVEMSQLNTMLREAAAAGATGFSDLTYVAADREAAYEQALSAAVDAAHDKAEALAKASGVYVGRVVNVVEESEASALELTVKGDTSHLDASDVSSLEVEMGAIPAEASVTVSYAIQ